MLRLKEDWWEGKKYVYGKHKNNANYVIYKRVNLLWWNWWAKVKLKQKIYDEIYAIKIVNLLNKEKPSGVLVDLDTMGIKNLTNR